MRTPSTTVRALRQRQARKLAERRSEAATAVRERMDAAVHFNGRCGEPDCALDSYWTALCPPPQEAHPS